MLPRYLEKNWLFEINNNFKQEERRMAMMITDECIACGACEGECPVEAITEGDTQFEIDPDKCVECEGYFDEPQCVSICPNDAIQKA